MAGKLKRTETVQVRLTKEVRASAELLAGEDMRTLSSWIERVVMEQIKRDRRRKVVL